MTKILDGELFANMIISGANNLYNHKAEVDALNVFPVPDGDTGTNMSLTAMAMAAEITQKRSASLTKMADVMSFATLRGARGNSGVILSQLFRGISKSLKGKDSCSGIEFAAALSDGAAAAYKAVMKPTEGTILTVARKSASGAALALSDNIEDIVASAVKSGNKALSYTPEQLPALKQAGVVDAGGQGWMFILEGALDYLKTGTIIESSRPDSITEQAPIQAQASIKTEDIKFKYCTEFIIEKTDAAQDAEDFKNTISGKGDCMMVIDGGDVVKVHIHTNHPGFVLEEAVKLGEMINLKIDNMKHQHRSIIESEPPAPAAEPSKPNPEYKKPKKPEEIKEFGFAAVASGKGFAEILKDLGTDKIIEGGQTMNPSAGDIIKAIKRIKARTVFVFPNNKNIIMTAAQAAEITEDKKVIVIPTRTIPECIAAMMAFNPKRTSSGNEEMMNKAVKNVVSASLTYAVRDTEINGMEIKKDDILGVKGSDIIAKGSDMYSVLEDLTDNIIDEDTEYITLYYGKDVKKSVAEMHAQMLEQKYEDDEIEISVKRGGQPVYFYVLSAE